MANISITNPTISNSETSDVTKLTANDNDIINGLTDGTKDLSIGALTVAGALTTSGGIATDATGDDIKSVAWTDYSASSTIVGWSAFTTKKIFYKKIGYLVFVRFELDGTSNSTNTSFSLPYAIPANLNASVACEAIDNGTGSANPGKIAINASATGATIYKTFLNAAWTASGTKSVYGEFWYETAS